MENHAFRTLVLLFSFLAICALPGSHKSRSHQARIQNPQTCQLLCPGQPPISLPPNFLQNCTSSSVKPSKPAQAQTTSSSISSENSTEVTDENTESNSQNATSRNNRRHKLRNAHISTQIRKQHQNQRSGRGKHMFRTETRILKRQVKASLLKQHKKLKDKAILDGCHVVCTEDGEGGNGGGENNEGSAAEGQDSEETDSDNYVNGEDTPIEIIYVPPIEEESKKPSQVYQINNYEIVEQVPQFGFEYEPTLFEGKHKKINKRKQHKDQHGFLRSNKHLQT